MENAIAAVQTGNISQRGAAKRFGVAESTLRDRLKITGTVRGSAHDTTQSESAPAKLKAADKAERDQWFADHQAGLSDRKIAEKFGRSRLSISKEIKRRVDAAAKSGLETQSPSEPANTGTSLEQHEPETERVQVIVGDSVPAPKTDQPEEPLTPTGQIGAHTKSIVAREKKTLQEKINQVKQIRELNKELELYWKPLQRNWQKYGRAVVLGNLTVAEKIFLRDGVLQPLAESLDLPKESSLEDCLWAMQKEAKEIEKNIRTVLYFYNCILSLTVEERPS